eukprot:550946-Pyramimonas_sp.AAC.1
MCNRGNDVFRKRMNRAACIRRVSSGHRSTAGPRTPGPQKQRTTWVRNRQGSSKGRRATLRVCSI